MNFKSWFGLAIVFVLTVCFVSGCWHFEAAPDAEAVEHAKREAEEFAVETAMKAEVETQVKPKAEVQEKNVVADGAATKAEAEKRANAELKEETYQLYSSVKRQKDFIDSVRYDRGQTFGGRMDILVKSYTAGERAMDNGDFTTANTMLKKADESARWLIENNQRRVEVQKLRKQAASMKADADKYNASKLSYVEYSDAQTAEKRAEAEYEKGNFLTVAGFLKTAIEKYGNAEKQAYEITRNELFATAELQKTHKQWADLLETAEKLRHFDEAKSAEYTSFALKLQKESLENLEPRLDVCAELNGKRVLAKINWEEDKPEGAESLFKLTKGKTYAAKLSYRDVSGQEYTGVIAPFTCSENGLKKITVIMKKVEFTGTISLPGNIPLEMVCVESGTFTMGKEDGENYAWEKEHSVTLMNAFWIGKTEVTQAQWKAVMGDNPSNFKGDNLPVEQVSWDDCKAFCVKLNKLFAGNLPPGYRFDLPTEAQWEYVARGGNKSKGYQYSGSNDIATVAWYQDNSGSKPHPVGLGKTPNELGLYDMTGNVREWCRDQYERGYARDPEFLRGNKGSDRVSRGGSWNDNARYCRSWYRYCLVPTSRRGYLGFRLALVRVQ